MADRYWVGGTNTWNATVGTKWANTSGGTGGASVPGASDLVFFDANSNPAGSGASYTVTRSVATALAGVTMSNPSAGTLTFTGASAWTFTGGATVSIGSGITWTATGAMNFAGATTGTATLSSGSSLTCGITLNLSDLNLSLSSNVTTTGALTLTAGTLLCNTSNITAATTTWTGGNIDFGTSGTISVSAASGTVVAASTWTGTMTNQNNGQVILSNPSTISGRTINISASQNFYAVPVTLNGAGTVTITTGAVGNFNTPNFTGALNYGSSGNLVCYGDVQIGGHAVPAGRMDLSNNSNITRKLSGGWADALNLNLSFASSTSTYKLTNELTLKSTATGFQLQPGMTLDLNGFMLRTPLFTYSWQTDSLATVNFGSGGTFVLNGNSATAKWDVRQAFNAEGANYRAPLNILGTGSILTYGSINYVFYDDSNQAGLQGPTPPSDYSNIELYSGQLQTLTVQGFGTTIKAVGTDRGTIKFIGTGSEANKLKNIYSDTDSGFSQQLTTGVTGVAQDIVYVGAGTLYLYNCLISYLNASPASTVFALTASPYTNANYGNNTGFVFTYIPKVSRLYSNGTLLVSGSFDEITLTGSTAYSISNTGIAYSKTFDEVTINPINSGLARRLYSNGTLMIAGSLDEVTGII